MAEDLVRGFLTREYYSILLALSMPHVSFWMLEFSKMFSNGRAAPRTFTNVRQASTFEAVGEAKRPRMID